MQQLFYDWVNIKKKTFVAHWLVLKQHVKKQTKILHDLFEVITEMCNKKHLPNSHTSNRYLMCTF